MQRKEEEPAAKRKIPIAERESFACTRERERERGKLRKRGKQENVKRRKRLWGGNGGGSVKRRGHEVVMKGRGRE